MSAADNSQQIEALRKTLRSMAVDAGHDPLDAALACLLTTLDLAVQDGLSERGALNWMRGMADHLEAARLGGPAKPRRNNVARPHPRHRKNRGPRA